MITSDTHPTSLSVSPEENVRSRREGRDLFGGISSVRGECSASGTVLRPHQALGKYSVDK